MAKVSKRFKEAEKLVDRDKFYTIEEAVALAKKPQAQNSMKQLKLASI